MKIRVLTAVFGVLLLLPLLLSACSEGGKPNETPTASPTQSEDTGISLFDEAGAYRYVVVRGEDCSKEVRSAATLLVQGLYSITGKLPEIVTDYVKRGESPEDFDSVCEILVGETNRPASLNTANSLGAGQYTVQAIGNKIVVLGAEDCYTHKAVASLLSALENGGGSIPQTAFFLKTYSLEDGPIMDCYYVRTMDGYYKTQGRAVSSAYGVGLFHSAASFEFNADCSGKVSVFIYAENAQSGNWAVRFTGYVDGERCEERYTINGNGETEFVLAENLPAGKHSFALYRQTEWDRGDTYVSAVKLDGTFLEPPQDKAYLIEFIGDSITAGFGNLSSIAKTNGNDWGGLPVFQDATQSYGFLTAQTLDADCSLVAVQGIGVACGNQPFLMGDIYEKFPCKADGAYTYAFEREADVVVIQLTTNDRGNMGQKGVSKEQVLDSMRALIEQVRGKNPDATIVVATGMMPAFTDDLAALVASMGGEDEDLYYFKMVQNLEGHDSHPSVEGHRENAERLAAFLLENGIVK